MLLSIMWINKLSIYLSICLISLDLLLFFKSRNGLIFIDVREYMYLHTLNHVMVHVNLTLIMII